MAGPARLLPGCRHNQAGQLRYGCSLGTHPLGTSPRKPSAVDGRGRFTARPGRPVAPDLRSRRWVNGRRMRPRSRMARRRPMLVASIAAALREEHVMERGIQT
jgi:hypothetical protein